MLHIIDWRVSVRLAIMPRPDDFAALRDRGVDTLVCALTEQEQQELGLVDEAQRATAAGLSYVAFPIVDRGVPSLEALRELACALADEVRDGRFVVAHCWAGIGRSGLIAGATLIQMGATATQAMELLTAARGIQSPETVAQQELLVSYSQSLQNRNSV